MTFPHLDLAANAHDRAGQHRIDEEWLARRWTDPRSRVLVVSGTRIRPVDGRLHWVAPADAPDGTRVLLGERDGTTWLAVLVDPADAPGDRAEWVGLRAVLPSLADEPTDAPLALHAIGLAEWHFATRHCPRCGAGLRSRSAGHELVCTGCGKAQFPRTDPAVIMTVVSGEPGSEDEVCLLGRQSVWPPGRFSTLAGFCEPGESLEDAVRREVHEEVGVAGRRGDLLRQPAVAVPGQPDARVRGPGPVPRDPGRRTGDRGRPLVHPGPDAGRCRVG